MKNMLFLFFLLLICCNGRNDASLSDNEVINFKRNIISKGDNYSFSRLVNYYSSRSDYYELLPYSIIMANKYNSGDGFLQVYKSIIQINNEGKFKESYLNNLSQHNKEFAISYLKEGAFYRDIDCIVFLSNCYRNGYGVEQDIEIADSLTNTLK